MGGASKFCSEVKRRPQDTEIFFSQKIEASKILHTAESGFGGNALVTRSATNQYKPNQKGVRVRRSEPAETLAKSNALQLGTNRAKYPNKPFHGGNTGSNPVGDANIRF